MEQCGLMGNSAPTLRACSVLGDLTEIVLRDGNLYPTVLSSPPPRRVFVHPVPAAAASDGGVMEATSQQASHHVKLAFQLFELFPAV